MSILILASATKIPHSRLNKDVLLVMLPKCGIAKVSNATALLTPKKMLILKNVSVLTLQKPSIRSQESVNVQMVKLKT